MKGHFKFKLLLLVAVLATALFSFTDAACHVSTLVNYAQNISPQHMVQAAGSLAIIPLANYVKDNCTISASELADLATKHGKIKILTVVLEAPIYDESGTIIDKGEFYSYAVKRPDPGTIKMMMNYAKSGKTDEYVGAFINNLIVGGDVEALKSNGLVYLGLATQVDNFLKPYESFLANA